MKTLHESIVEESEIDELGHLSVPFYEQRALTASHVLLSRAGLDAGSLADQGLELTLVDAFSRNLREQFLGAELAVQGGVLSAEADQVRFYQQIINTRTDDLSAIYVQTFTLQKMESRETVAFDPGVLEQLRRHRIDWPEPGQPRSLDLSRPAFPLTLAEGRRRDLASRPPRRISLDECNQQGFLESGSFQHLPYSGAGSEDPSTQWVFELPDGTRVGLADLETRNTLFSVPREGARIQVFSADVDIARKTLRRSHWVFNLDSAALISAGSVVTVCLDLDARRALEIPDSLLEILKRRFHPDLV